ncbi:MAG TPA: UDP-3-O-acyl-N-acetylglucosamine deacetylase [Holophagaceae bacterium]|nr:UDP-3-O-acyl-N-acetylglucosamine deacetylase [Holophagaceae bacterium]
MPRATTPQTLAREITISGHGLHGARPCTVRLVPVDRPTGLRFRHLGTGVEIPVSADFAGDIQLATTLVKDGVRLQTIEHLLSALVGLEIEHLLIEVDGEGADVELPILDGSAHPWMEAILQAGARSLDGKRRFVKVLRPLEVDRGGKRIRVSPYDGLRVRYTIDFPVASLGRQSRELSLSPEKYRAEVGAARTFCLEQEIDWMRANGLALGGSLENAVVYGAEGPLNESLRFHDEAVRHKILDLLGDLALLGAPLLGLVEAHAAGHALHVDLVKALQSDRSAWTWAELPEPAKTPALFRPALVASA